MDFENEIVEGIGGFVLSIEILSYINNTAQKVEDVWHCGGGYWLKGAS